MGVLKWVGDLLNPRDLFRVLKSDTGRPVVQAWVIVFVVFGVGLVLIWVGMTGVQFYDSDTAQVVGLPVDRIVLTVGVFATAIAALVYNVQKNQGDEADFSLRAEMHHAEQFRLWAEPLQDRTESPATWEVLKDLGNSRGGPREPIIRVAVSSLEQYAFEFCLRSDCKNGPTSERPCCEEHPLPARLGEGPATCIRGS